MKYVSFGFISRYDHEDKNSGGSSRTNRPANDALPVLLCHVETVVLLSKHKSEKFIDVELEMSELDLTRDERKKTYH